MAYHKRKAQYDDDVRESKRMRLEPANGHRYSQAWGKEVEAFAPYNDTRIPILWSTKIDHTFSPALQSESWDSNAWANYYHAINLLKTGITRHDFGLPEANKTSSLLTIKYLDLYLDLSDKKIYVAACEKGLMSVPDYLKLCGIALDSKVRFTGEKPAWAKTLFNIAETRYVSAIYEKIPLDLDSEIQVYSFFHLPEPAEPSGLWGWVYSVQLKQVIMFPLEFTAKELPKIPPVFTPAENKLIYGLPDRKPSLQELGEALFKQAQELERGTLDLQMTKTRDDYLNECGYKYGKYAPENTPLPQSRSRSNTASSEDEAATPISSKIDAISKSTEGLSAVAERDSSEKPTNEAILTTEKRTDTTSIAGKISHLTELQKAGAESPNSNGITSAEHVDTTPAVNQTTTGDQKSFINERGTLSRKRRSSSTSPLSKRRKTEALAKDEQVRATASTCTAENANVETLLKSAGKEGDEYHGDSGIDRVGDKAKAGHKNLTKEQALIEKVRNEVYGEIEDSSIDVSAEATKSEDVYDEGFKQGQSTPSQAPGKEDELPSTPDKPESQATEGSVSIKKPQHISTWSSYYEDPRDQEDGQL